MLPGLESYMHSSEPNNRTVSKFSEYLFWFLNLFPNRLWSKLKPKFKFLRYFANYLVHTDHVTFDDTLIYCSKTWRPNTNESNPNASEKTFYGKIQIFKLFNRQCFTIKRRHSHSNGNAFQKLYKHHYSSTMANSLTLFQAKWVNFWTYFFQLQSQGD